ncbi:unnamed protein product [Cyprideis torosa]|uniref:Uncharacterized protein n=1 Tax=Cyprideis torosa TaxID=163714 RepID=A0A7R8W917_9CRUS|nr:unnamed protein product [Cyprideis torosa]CAG0883938.1 unnamed protein product [Cyprideis torosa]
MEDGSGGKGGDPDPSQDVEVLRILRMQEEEDKEEQRKKDAVENMEEGDPVTPPTAAGARPKTSVMHPADAVAAAEGNVDDTDDEGFQLTKAQKKRRMKFFRKEAAKKVRQELESGDYILPAMTTVKKTMEERPKVGKTGVAEPVAREGLVASAGASSAVDFAAVVKKGEMAAEKRIEVNLRKNLTVYITRVGDETGDLDEEDRDKIERDLNDKLAGEIEKTKKVGSITRIAVGRVKLTQGKVKVIVGAQRDLEKNDGLALWEEKGCQRDKLIVGIPFYGRTYTLGSPMNTGLRAGKFGKKEIVQSFFLDKRKVLRIKKWEGGGKPGEFTNATGFMSFYEVMR